MLNEQSTTPPAGASGKVYDIDASAEMIARGRREVEDDRQLALGFAKEEARQLEADDCHWKRRLADLAAETARDVIDYTFNNGVSTG